MLVAVGSQPPLSDLERVLMDQGYRRSLPPSESLEAAACWVSGRRMILIGPGCFARWAGWAEAGLATAGTATEQLWALAFRPSLCRDRVPSSSGDLLSVRAGCWGEPCAPVAILPSWLNDSRNS